MNGSPAASPSKKGSAKGRAALQGSQDGRRSLSSSQELSSTRKPLNLVSLSNFFLIALPDKLLLQVPKETTSLSISDSGEVNATSLKMEMIPTPVYGDSTIARRVFAVLGIIRLALGRHLIVVTDRELCGTVGGRAGSPLLRFLFLLTEKNLFYEQVFFVEKLFFFFVKKKKVWKATAVEMIPIPAQMTSGSPEQVKVCHVVLAWSEDAHSFRFF
jgi:hypothetical protein